MNFLKSLYQERGFNKLPNLGLGFPVFIGWIFLLMIRFPFGEMQPASLTPEQEAGKKIYTLGEGSTQIPVIANMAGVEVPGSAAPCINCHGQDGKGIFLGEVVPADIRWSTLSLPLENNQETTRIRPAYTERTIKKPITLGYDSNGESLHNLMPRYNMSLVDINNLIAYLKIME